MQAPTSELVPVDEVAARIDETSASGRTGFVPRFLPDPIKANDRCALHRMTVGPMDRLLTPEERSASGRTWSVL